MRTQVEASPGTRFGSASSTSALTPAVAVGGAMAIKRLGAGYFYLISIKDADGENYDVQVQDSFLAGVDTAVILGAHLNLAF